MEDSSRPQIIDVQLPSYISHIDRLWMWAIDGDPSFRFCTGRQRLRDLEAEGQRNGGGSREWWRCYGSLRSGSLGSLPGLDSHTTDVQCTEQQEMRSDALLLARGTCFFFGALISLFEATYRKATIPEQSPESGAIRRNDAAYDSP